MLIIITLPYAKERKEINDEDRPSIYVLKYSFTRYLNGIDRPRRSERYNKIKKSNLESSKHYTKYYIKNDNEAINSKLIHRGFSTINKLRLYHNMKPRREIPIYQNIFWNINNNKTCYRDDRERWYKHETNRDNND